MSSTTPINAIQYPSLSDTADITTAFAGYTTIDSRLVPRFATVTARNSAIAVPTEGQMAYCLDTGELYVYKDSAWLGSRWRTAISTSDQSVTDSVTLTDSSYITLSMEASSKYIVKGMLYWLSSGTTTNGIQISFTSPTSATGYLNLIATTAGGTFFSSTNNGFGNSNSFSSLLVNTSTTRSGAIDATVVTTSSGSFTLRFAESSAVGGTTSVIIKSGSYIQALKVA